MLVGALAAIAVGAAVAIVALLRMRARTSAAAARWATTARASVLLAEALDARDGVEQVLQLFVPQFGDWCAVHLVDGDHVRRIGVHADPALRDSFRAALAELTFDADALHGPANVIRTGESELIRRVAADTFARQRVETRNILASAGAGSAVVVPLKARTQTVGALTLTRREPDQYDESDVEWARDLGHRIGLAVENARLYAEARELFEQTVSANFVSTPAGRILACNQTFAALVGYDSVADVHAVDAPSFYADESDRTKFIAELRARRRLIGFEGTVKRRDGRLVSVSANAVGTFNDRGDLTKITGFLVDRTATRELETQLRQAQRLEAVGQLAGGIAHDFNNLLTVIIGSAELIRSDPEYRPSGEPDPLDELTKAARRAAGLTQQLLAFSRRQVLQPREVDLNAALRHVHSMLRRLIHDHVVLIVDLDPRVGRVRVDPGQLDQVVMNLVMNASDAMPMGGTTTVTTANVTLDDEDVAQHPYVRPGHYVALTVRDTGSGMDEATRARVFEPFFTTKPEGKGTGLGLSTVYGIVKQSGGYVWIASEPGAGTTVKICLPAVVSA
ncbi:MAG TPA: ATP-binding protein [Vicinamibacterales bacterium]|nr:ATP-binding protein [Vicinamibacterales bacterium]